MINKIVESYIGKYEADLLKYNIKRSLSHVDNSLYRFFKYFPEQDDLREFTSLDWKYFEKVAALDGLLPKQIERVRLAVHGFFQWLLDFQDFPIPNPARLQEPRSIWQEIRGGGIDTSVCAPRSTLDKVLEIPSQSGESVQRDTPATSQLSESQDP